MPVHTILLAFIYIRYADVMRIKKNLAGYLCIQILLLTLKQFYHGKHFVYHRSGPGYYLGNFLFGWLFYRWDNSHPVSYCSYNDHLKIS